MADYKIQLGVHIETSEIKEQISKYNQNSNNAKLKLGIKLDTDDLKRQINQLNLGGNGKGVAIPINTASLEQSLKEVKGIIADIKSSLGTLDGKGMKDLLSSVNQIAAALGKVENESDSLVKSLNALSKKDFSVNIGVNMGKSASQRASEQGDIKRDAISQLKQQARALEDYLDQYYKVAQQGAGVAKLTQGTKIFSDYWELSPNIGNTKNSLKQQVSTYKQYIKLIQEAAKLKGVDLSGVTSSFSKTTDEIDREVREVSNGVREADEQLTKLRNIFGGGVDSESLTSIVNDLKEIKNALVGLPSEQVEGLSQTFQKLSDSLDTFVKNINTVKIALGSGLTDDLLTEVNTDDARQVGQRIGQQINQGVSQGLNNSDNILDSFRHSLENIGMGSDEIDKVANRIGKLGIEIQTLKQSGLSRSGKTVSVEISGIDKYGQAIKLTQQYSAETGKLTKNIQTVSTVQQKAGTSAQTFIKQQKRAVADLTNQINQVNRSAIDQNAARPIKDSAHLDTLKSKYTEIISAIERMGNASSDTFEDERNKVRTLISEYKSLKSEYKNAENVALEMDGNDFASGLEIAKNKLAEFKSQAKGFSQLTQTVNNLDNAIEKVGDVSSLKEFNNQLRVAKSELNKVEVEANQASKVLGDAWKKIDGLSKKVAHLDPNVNTNEFKELSSQLEEAEADYESLKRTFSGKLSTNQFGILQANVDDLAGELSRIEKQFADTRAELARKIEIKLESGKFSTQIQKVNSDANKLSTVSIELRTKLDALNDAEKAMNNAFKNGGIEERITAYRNYERVLTDVQNQLKQNKIAEKDAFDANKLSLDKNALSSDMSSWLRDNSAAAKKFGDEIRQLQARLKACDNGVDFNTIKREFRNVTKEAKTLGLTGLSTFDKLKAKFKEYAAYLSAAEVFMWAEQGLRSMFEQVKLIDSAMTELKKVTNETDAAYEQFLTNAASRAREIGTTIDGLVSSTADFARLGYGFEDAQGLAEIANIYAVVGDEIEGVEGATESLISTMAAFKDEMNGMSKTDFAMSIIDKFNEIGNNFAISSGGIGEALERSASSLMAANNTIDESIALITAANTVVQDPEQVGTAFKTISMRIRGAKTEMSELGLDTDGMVESTAKLRSEILALSGVDIMENG